jgi:hypothetical protein
VKRKKFAKHSENAHMMAPYSRQKSGSRGARCIPGGTISCIDSAENSPFLPDDDYS